MDPNGNEPKHKLQIKNKKKPHFVFILVDTTLSLIYAKICRTKAFQNKKKTIVFLHYMN